MDSASRTAAGELQRFDEFGLFLFSLTNLCSYPLVSQNRHEVYLNVAEYGPEFIKYLKDELQDTKGKEAKIKPESFMKIHSFGPFDLTNVQHVNFLSHILLAYTIKVSEAPQSPEASHTEPQK